MAIALATAGRGPAIAQYREDMPPVMTPAPAVPTGMARPVALAAFRGAYTRAGRPRLAVLWNRELTDRLASQHDSVVQVERHASGSSAIGVSRDGRVIGRQGRADSVETARAGTREVDVEGAAPVLGESADWAVMAAFNSRLQEAGVRLVDRAVAMRARAAASGAPARLDRQTIEMKALQDKAEIILDVMQTPEPDTPLGVAFRVEAKSVATGAILASVADGGSPEPARPGRFVAGANGFEREAPRAPGANEVGRALADRLLERLSAFWGAR